MYQASLMAVSFASEPELANSTRLMPAGAIRIRRSASSALMAGHLAREAVIERQLAHLPVSGVREPPLGKAERRAPQPRHTFEVPPALVVVNVDTLTANDDQRPFRLHLPQIGGRMEVEREITARGRGCQRHGELLGITTVALLASDCFR